MKPITPLKRDVIIGIIFVLAAGTLAHFLYDWSGDNAAVGLFAPVSESIWEHMKLVFFPMLLYTLFLTLKYRGKRLCTAFSFCLGILAGTLLIPALYYAYHSLLGRDVFLLDIGVFVLSTLAAFLLSFQAARSCRCGPCALLPVFLVCVLLVCFFRFTFHPPALEIFEDPALYRH